MLLFALWFFLPAGAANAAPVIAAKLPFLRHLNAPMDGGRIWSGERFLGAHKTWRGFISGVFAATVMVYMQQLIYHSHELTFLGAQSIAYLDYSPFLLGFLFGGGALLGDAAKSLVKRRLGIKDGEAWFPFDQIDYIIGACLFMALVSVRTPIEYSAIFIVWFVLHVAFSYVGYRLHLKAKPI